MEVQVLDINLSVQEQHPNTEIRRDDKGRMLTFWDNGEIDWPIF